MPIRPENRKRYPTNWTREIVPAILARAGYCCEGSPAYPECRAPRHAPHPVTGARVRLTVAHLDHTPEHCDPSDLRAWCERCHNTYDAPHRAETRRRLRPQQPGAQLALFADEGSADRRRGDTLPYT